MATESHTEQAELAHPSAVAPNDQRSGGPLGGADEQDDMNPSWSALDSLGNGPVLVCAWDKFRCGSSRKKIRVVRILV